MKKKTHEMTPEVITSNVSNEEYKSFLTELKDKIATTQLKVAVSVNKELIKLYWEIGRSLSAKIAKEGWGAKTMARLAKDLGAAFPGVKGFSLTNIKYMVQFAKEYPNFQIGQQAVGQIPWGHNILIMQKIPDAERRLWYVSKVIENGWSRNVLLHWIDSNLHGRQGKAITNFQETIPQPHSDLAKETIKNPYLLDFLTLREDHDEEELENALVRHMEKFLLELGKGFCFVGRQYRIGVSGRDYLIDLLFYNYVLRRFFVVELKAREFDPRDTGQLNFYLAAVDNLLKQPDDHPTIGLLLCKTKDNITVEYALQNSKSPIGVSGYEISMFESFKNEFKGVLPTIEEIEAELEGDDA